MKKSLFLLALAIGVFISSTSFATSPVGAYVFLKRTPVVGQTVYPSAYSGGYCTWQDGDGQPWPVNPYSRSQDWVGQACKVVAVYTYCVLLTPLFPIVTGSYYINWDINHV